MSLLRNLLILGFFIVHLHGLRAQGLYYTDPIVICDIRDINNVPQSLPDPETYDDSVLEEIPNCQSTFRFELNNPNWYQFVATATNAALTINIDASSCVNSNTPTSTGIQYALVEVIDDEVIPLFCNSEANRARTVSVMASDLVPGRTYYLVLDGFASSICDYSIWNISGLGLADITQTISEITINDVSQSSSCRIGGLIKLEAVNIAGGPVENAAEYTWHLEDRDAPGNFTLDTVTQSSILELSGLTTSVYSVTVQGSNACDVSNSLPEEITILESPRELLLEDPALCISDITRGYMPTDPNYIGPVLTSLPTNPTRDTFYVEKTGIDGCPITQLIPVNIQMSDRGILDTAYCGSQPFIFQGERYLPREEPYFVDYDSGGLGVACDSIIELTVTQFFFDGPLVPESCGGSPTLTVEPFLTVPFNYEDFATYSWKDANGIEVGTEPLLSVPRSGEYTLDLTMSKGDNDCIFTLGPQFASAAGTVELDPRCTGATNSSVTVSWNNIDGATYIIAVDGQTIGSQTETTYTQMDLTEGQAVTVDIFAVINGSNCPAINDNSRCRAMSCSDIQLSVDIEESSVCLAENITINPIEITAAVVGADGSGAGIWTASSGGVLEAPTDQNNIFFDPIRNGEGVYTLTYTYTENDCPFSVSSTIEVVQPPISTILNFVDEICVNTELELVYNGNAGINAIAIWGGNANDAMITGSMPGPFTLTWDTPGNKVFTFMIQDGDCMSEVADYSVDVASTLTPPILSCNATSDGLRASWNSQLCVGSYNVYINGDLTETTIEPELLITGLMIGESVDVQVEAINSCGCADAISDVFVGCVFEDCPDIEVELSSPSTAVCLDPNNILTLQIEETIIGGDTLVGVGNWTGPGIGQSGEFFPILAGVGDHVIRFEWIEGGCSFGDSVMISVQQDVGIQLLTTDPCINDEFGILEVILANGSMDVQVIVDEVDLGPGLMYDITQGPHEIIIIDNVSACISQFSDTIKTVPTAVDIFQQEYFVSQNQSLDFSIEPELSDLVKEIYWTFNGDTICNEIACTYFPEMSGEFCLDIIYDSECTNYQECTQIEFIPTFKMYEPNVISMSDNAVDNTFRIFSNDPRAVVSELTIFDRWGNRVFENNDGNADNTWNPSLDPAKFNPGVFVYLAKITKGDGQVLNVKGTVTVLK